MSELPNKGVEMDDVFDVVIVGAGSAGCALARRLTDDPSVNVALVEAGGHQHIPSSPRRPNTSSSGERRSIGTTSRYRNGHGGSSTPTATRSSPRGHERDQRHGLLARGREDFDGWEQAGCAGWGWEQVRSYEELEELVLPRVPDNTNELSQVFIDAAKEVGFPFNPFFDDGDLEGCGWNRMSIHQGQRQSSYRAFVEPVLDRPNLQM